MKKFLIVLSVFLFGGVSTFAYQYYGDSFKDDSELADWAKVSVYKMKDAGVINGYSDGTFGPGNYVTRAELATMLDRYSEKIVNDNIYRFVYALDRTDYLDLKSEDKAAQAALIVADAGFFMLDGAPKLYNDGKPNSIEFFEDKDIQLPDGYSLYRELPAEFYLRYQGDIGVQDNNVVDRWFGPFSGYDTAYKQ